ncbi:hypothetical protein Dehly_0561 [Dehalogenimonas lykanthroporepellens BL-DC-9]|jgi:hypothetical protein|nr:hypothetical protein Dehly_0561 [Dehalogenimonas lykanthroporepellens BL-DC-9]
MLEGKCPKCGYQCAGWGLSFPRHQSCAKCGTAMLIFEDGQPLGVGYSPFSAEHHEPAGSPRKASPTLPHSGEDTAD